MVAALAVSAVAEVASAAQSARVASQQATAATTIANYNAKVDIANAQQMGMDAAANISKQRTEDQSYLSSQRAAYAASGILGGTGSPLAVQATTAGRQEQDIQQYYANTQEKEAGLYEAAQLGVYEGAEQASAYHLQGAADIFKGIGDVASISGKIAGVEYANNPPISSSVPAATTATTWAGGNLNPQYGAYA